jgi:hypothetical protein
MSRAMNRQRTVFVVALAVAAVLSLVACYPLTNILTGNEGGWFSMQNIDEYGDDLDARAERHGGEVVVFTGHPSYVMDADNARLLNDQPRNHYFASTFNDSRAGDRWYRNLTRALRTGQVDIAVSGPMTETILEQNQTAGTAFLNHYCRVEDPEAQRLYGRTHATLYEYEPDCPDQRRPNIG